MATSIRDLLTEIRRRTTHPDDRILGMHDADAAVAALAPFGRALSRLADDGLTGTHAGDRETTVRHLAAACITAASGWRPGTGPVTEQAAAAADLLGLLRDRLTGAERWSAAAALSDAVRRCAQTAQRHPSYQGMLNLAHVYVAAAAVIQLADAAPPDPLRRTALDRQLPYASLPAGLSGIAVAAEAAPALAAALRSAAHGPGITLSDGLSAIAAAYTAAHYAATLAAALRAQTVNTDGEPWRTAPAAWRAAHCAFNVFDDGTRGRPPDATAVTRWARLLDGGLKHDLTPDVPLREQLRARPDLPELATSLRQVANHLPDVAEHLHLAVQRWAARRQLAAAARNLPYREGLLHAHLHNTIVIAQADDLDPPRAALRRAATLSTELAAELHRSAGRVGIQPQPYLAAAYTPNRGTTLSYRTANEIRAAAQQTAHTPWTLPPPTGRRRAR